MLEADQECHSPPDDDVPVAAAGPPAPNRHGPLNYLESCMWARDQVGAMILRDGGAETAKHVFSSGLLVVTDYSGIGSPEMALRMIGEALQHYNVLPEQMNVKFWHACDSEPACMSVLQSYGEHMPEHILQDILDRAPAECLSVLEALRAKYKDLYNNGLQEKPREAMKLLELHGRAFLEEAAEYLKGVTFIGKTTCAVHGCKCPVFPPAHIRAHYKFFLAIAGWTCVPWSSMSHKPLRWLHECSIVFLVWLFSTLQQLPDWIVGECVVYFDDVMLKRILDGFGYDVAVLLRNPADDGFPCDRRRKFMIATRRATIKMLIPCTQETARSIFNRKCMVDARMYFRAPSSEVKAYLDQLAVARFLPEGEWELKDLLEYGRRKRLIGFTKNAVAAGKAFIIADLNQNPAFWKRVSSTCPALLRKSYLCGITVMQTKNSVNRPLLVCETFGVQAVPVLLPASHFLTDMLPGLLRYSSFRKAREGSGTVSMAEYQSMAGNGQHLASIGSILILSLFGFGLC